ncbi:MAG: cytochrome C oxidase subunit IV family protein [Bacteroidota bacterium]
MKPEDDEGVVYPDPQKDYHGHPDYRKTLIYLLVLFGISLLVGYVFSPFIAISIIFATAIWKTSLVVKNFMHLKYEPFLIWLTILVVLFTIFAFFWGVVPDITMVPLEVVPK